MKTYASLGRAFGDVYSDVQSASDADTVAGIKALNYFWQAAQPLNSQMPTDFTAFLQGLKSALVPSDAASAWPGYVGPYYPSKGDDVFKIKVAGIGQMANVGGTSSGGFLQTLFHSGSDVTPMSDDQIKSAMQTLAQQGGGKIPTDFNAFTAAFTGAATQVNFYDALWYTVGASAANIVQGAQAAGNAVIATGEGALNALNIFAEYEVYFIAAALAVAAYVGYKLYLKPLSSRIGGGAVKQNPRRRRRKNPDLENLVGKTVIVKGPKGVLTAGKVVEVFRPYEPQYRKWQVQYPNGRKAWIKASRIHSVQG